MEASKETQMLYIQTDNQLDIVYNEYKKIFIDNEDDAVIIGNIVNCGMDYDEKEIQIEIEKRKKLIGLIENALKTRKVITLDQLVGDLEPITEEITE